MIMRLIIAYIVLLFGDFIWFKTYGGWFFRNNLGHLLRLKDGAIDVYLLGGALAYLVMALGISVFVMPRVSSWCQALIFGALYGLIVYGTYDWTNFAVIRGWPLKVVFVDIGWGIFICGLASVVTFVLSPKT